MKVGVECWPQWSHTSHTLSFCISWSSQMRNEIAALFVLLAFHVTARNIIMRCPLTTTITQSKINEGVFGEHSIDSKIEQE
ncbi:hypothetical protein Y032_1033g3450 [Ancylostoma ceylanicum]|uniref:Uncharacterized protein n=1 Tax=Ancylostoma ceylanicum TaxID=53326 RepID=A0A016W7G9_9BILA|nr:hypothetical protein Y032_1033g3450 [Ancylostoma ceylanicum]